MLGGLARRSTFFKNLKKQNKNIFFIAGFYEITNFGKSINNNINQLLTIYKRLPYNLKVLTKKEKELIKNQNILNGWIVSEDDLSLKDYNSPFGKIYFIVLPEKKDILLLEKTKNRLKQIKKGAYLLIGISPYGYLIEEEILKKYNFAEVFDIFLGSGRGASFTYEYVKNNCIWIRPISMGKAIYLITITKSNGEKLKPGKNIEIKKRFLTKTIPEDSQISSIVYEQQCN